MATKHPKILIVDDSAFMREVLKDLLTSNFDALELYEAEKKQQAIDQIVKFSPDVILLDIVMHENELEGLEILEKIKGMGVEAKVIMITSVGQTAIVDRCKDLGVQAYIQKPFNTDEVVEAINKVLA